MTAIDPSLQSATSPPALVPPSPTSASRYASEQIRPISSPPSPSTLPSKSLPDDSSTEQVAVSPYSPNSPIYAEEIDQKIRSLSLHNFAECYRMGKGVHVDLVKAALYHQKAVDCNYPPSMVRLGRLYEKGEGTSKDEKRAVELYAHAVRLNYVSAQTALAQCYRYGRGVEKNPSRAFKMLQAAANAKDYEALVPLGDCYRDGVGVEQDYDAAVDSYKRAVDHNVVLAHIRIGDCFLEGIGMKRDPEMAFRWFETAAESGEPLAYMPLAKCYALGLGVTQNKLRAFKYLLGAAHQAGNPRAMLLLAEYYHKGEVVQQNDKFAADYWKHAAERGNVAAKLALADCLANGAGVSRDEKAAFEMIRTATDDGDPMAFLCLAECYLDGIGIEHDSGKGVFLLQRAVELGCTQANLILAHRYLKGDGVPHSISDAIICYERAAEDKSADACLALGQIYLRGIEVNADYPRAVSYLKDATSFGSVEASVLLAQCLKHGVGVTVNKCSAFDILSKAAASDHVGARRELALSYLKGDGCAPDTEKARSKLSALCDDGDGVAARYLGELFYKGKDCTLDGSRASEYFKKGSAAGDSISMRWLGFCYRDGVGVELDPKQSFNYFNNAVDAGDSGALGLLARCYEEGIGVERDYVQAVSLYEQAVKSGKQEYLKCLLHCYTKASCDEAVVLREAAVLEKLHNEGKKEVDMRLAWLYYNGWGVQKDVQKAVQLLEDVLKSGVNCLVLRLLAHCFSGKEFGPEGDSRALGYLDRASEMGFPEGKVMLARFLLSGICGVQDENRAISLLEEASVSNCVAASELLGDLYFHGHVILNGKQYGKRTVDHVRGAEFYSLALSSGYGSYRYARCLLKGHGIKRDVPRALHLLRQAVKKECTQAQLVMCRYFERGAFGIPVDIREALRLYENSVHRVTGHTRGRAMYRYASLLREHGTKLERFSSQEAADKRVSGLLEGARRDGCAAAGNDLAVLVIRKTYGPIIDDNSLGVCSVEDVRDRDEGLTVNTGRDHEHAKEEVDPPPVDDGSTPDVEGTHADERTDLRQDDESCGTAFRTFLEMAQLGEARSFTNAGICLEQGIGVMRDVTAAKSHYEQGVERKDTVSMNNLAVLLIEEGGEENIYKAKDLLDRAFSEGEMKALVNLGKLREGSGVTRMSNNGNVSEGNGGNCNTTIDDGEMTNTFSNATNQTDDRANGEENAATIDTEAARKDAAARRGDPENKAAFSMYQKAAEAGCAEAMFNVAACYEAEIGTERDERLAIRNYQQAMNAGIHLAAERLKMYQQ